MILKDVHINHDYANLSMRNRLSKYGVRDRSLISQLVYGSIQHYRYLRFLWSSFVEGELEEEIAVLLDMTTYQLLFLDKLPDYAVINDAVEISKKIIYGKYQKLVNAVSRKIKNITLDFEVNNETELALKTSHPDWLVKLWLAHYGYEFTKSLCFFNNTVRKAAVRVNTLKISREELLKDSDFEIGLLGKQALYFNGNILESEYYQNQTIIIQDEASQYIGEIVDPQKGDRILDACSAPGTKAIELSMMLEGSGEIIALEPHEHRISLIQNNIELYGIKNIEVLQLDARLASKHIEGLFDKVLVDAPCSGFGTLRHKPDIKIRICPEDIDSLVKLQSEILTETAKLVKIGGYLIYATCTINKKENEKQVEKFLKEHSEFQLVEEKQINPMEYQTDGFYYAKMRRKMNDEISI